MDVKTALNRLMALRPGCLKRPAVEVYYKEFILHPTAMVYERTYGFTVKGQAGRMQAVRHRDESVEVYWGAPPCAEVETVVEDCRNSGGFLSAGVVCLRNKEPWCYYHETKERARHGPEHTAEGRGG